MKIAFLAPIEATTQYKQQYTAIIEYLTKVGHSVVHALSVTSETLGSWTEEQRAEYFSAFYTKIVKCDLIIAECSYPSVHVGFEISYAIQQGKEIIMLKSKDSLPDVMTSDQLNLNKNIYIYEYERENLFAIIREALECNPIKKYQKYNVLFPTEMVNKLNQISKKKNLPKSVYIRQLLEKGLAMETE
jgi:2'-deoxynucleoside 5'-phosphate N-hydrolase